MHSEQIRCTLSFADFDSIVKMSKSSPQNFPSKKEIVSNSHTYPQMCLFYADWCGHCVRFKPSWDDAELEDKKASWIKFDCTSRNPSVVKEFNIRSYPTIKKFWKGVEYEFNDTRSKEALLNFAAAN